MVQMVVLVGLVVQMATNPITFPSTLFFFFVSGTFLFSALLHPQEFSCLFHGFTYYLCIPTMYLLLSIYTFTNLHVVSWGTREDKTREAALKEEEEMRQEAETRNKKAGEKKEVWIERFRKNKKGFLLNCFGQRETYDELVVELKSLSNEVNELSHKLDAVTNGKTAKEAAKDLKSGMSAEDPTKTVFVHTLYSNSSGIQCSRDETNENFNFEFSTDETSLYKRIKTPSIIHQCSSTMHADNLSAEDTFCETLVETPVVSPEWMKDQECLSEGVLGHLSNTEYVFFQVRSQFIGCF